MIPYLEYNRKLLLEKYDRNVKQFTNGIFCKQEKILITIVSLEFAKG